MASPELNLEFFSTWSTEKAPVSAVVYQQYQLQGDIISAIKLPTVLTSWGHSLKTTSLTVKNIFIVVSVAQGLGNIYIYSNS